MTWEAAFIRLACVRDELEASRFALGYAQRRIAAGEDVLEGVAGVKTAHLSRSASRIDATYTLRLFAEFEAILRDYLAVARPSPRRRRVRMELLLNRVAAICSIPYDALTQAHRVREHRNSLIHLADRPGQLTF